MDFPIHSFWQPQVLSGWLLSGVTISSARAIPINGVLEEIF
jgi:hypothetical protein